MIKAFDIYAFEKMRARHLCLGPPVPSGFFGTFYNLLTSTRRSVKKIKRRAEKVKIFKFY